MPSAIANQLLTSLSLGSRQRILERAVAVPLPHGFTFYGAGETPSFAYFLTSGLACIAMTGETGISAEVTLVGREGFVGCIQLLGPLTDTLSAFMQIEGTGIRVPMEDLEAELSAGGDVSRRLLEYVQYQILNITNVVGCSLFHPAEARLARWLLAVVDRTGNEDITVTQTIIGKLLGVRRTTVNLAMTNLAGRDLIHAGRGKITILDRERLEGNACGCYEITRLRHESLYRTSVNQRDE